MPRGRNQRQKRPSRSERHRRRRAPARRPVSELTVRLPERRVEPESVIAHLGPTTASEIGDLLGLPASEIEKALLRMEASGAILRGKFRPADSRPAASAPQEPEIEWCERRLLARLSAFAGGWTLAAAEAGAGGQGAHRDAGAQLGPGPVVAQEQHQLGAAEVGELEEERVLDLPELAALQGPGAALRLGRRSPEMHPVRRAVRSP